MTYPPPPTHPPTSSRRPDASATAEGLPTGPQPMLGDERFRALVSSVKDYAIFMLDPHGRIESWNAGAERIKGYRTEEILGQHMSRFYTPEDLERGLPGQLLETALCEGRVESEGWRVRKDGTRFWADVVITRVVDEQGRLCGFAKVTRDLTERRNVEEELRQSEQRFRLLVEGLKDYALFMLDPDGRVATWNMGAERIKGYRASEILGAHFSRFYAPEDIASGRPEAGLQRALDEGRFEDEAWRVRKDGTRFWASVVITSLREATGRHIGFAKVTRDLTERLRAEQEQIRLAHAEEAVRLRDEFLSIAAHELRTPLSAVQLQLQSLLERPGGLDARTRTKVERALRSGERLVTLVETLLDVSRISTGSFTLNPTRFSLGSAVEDVVERFREHAVRASSPVSVRVEGPVTGLWDRLRIEQLITNLLTNSLKYAQGSPVELSVQGTESEVVLTVSDSGPGIPASEWDRIFRRFERAAPITNYGGLGLGLYVARQIVEAHGGAIQIAQLRPEGAHFVIRLPREPAERGMPE
jgi:PAS domain S-box-containing protein